MVLRARVRGRVGRRPINLKAPRLFSELSGLLLLCHTEIGLRPMNFEDRPADTTPQAWEAYLKPQAYPRDGPVREAQASFYALRQPSRACGGRCSGVGCPHASEHEVLLRLAALHLDRETMIRAYGWDPESDEAIPGPA